MQCYLRGGIIMDHRDYAFEAMDEWKALPPGGFVLDVGARDTACKERLEKRLFLWEGIDSAPENDEVIKGNMEHFPMNIKDCHYHLLFSCHSFEHCERPVDALREFYRVLRKGGKVFIVTPEPNKHNILCSDQDHLFCLNEMQMERLLIYAGFTDIKVWTSTRPWSQDREFKTIISTGEKP